MSVVHKDALEKGPVEKSDVQLEPVSPRQSCCTARNILCYRWWTPILWILALILVALAIAVPVLLHVKPWQADDPNFTLRLDDETYPFISAARLAELMNSENGVTVLDAREPPSTITTQAGLDRNIPGFTRARWTDFMNGDDLMSPEDMGQAYRDRGVMNDRPVVVYGGWAASNFWGEEARVWWHLHWLNHTDAHILYGGVWAWDNSDYEGAAISDEAGDFTPSVVPERLISTEDMLDIVENSPNSSFIIDVRAANEYNGEAPFGSEYGGHIAGSFSYPWRTVFDAEGNLRPLDTIRSEVIALDTRGFSESRQVIAYCTRGIRASFGTAVFIGAGFDVILHEGSWQEWTETVPQDVSAALQAEQG